MAEANGSEPAQPPSDGTYTWHHVATDMENWPRGLQDAAKSHLAAQGIVAPEALRSDFGQPAAPAPTMGLTDTPEATASDAPQTTHEPTHLPESAEITLHTQKGSGQGVDAEQIKYEKLALAEQWLEAQLAKWSDEREPVPVSIASEIAVVAQRHKKRVDESNDGMVDEESVDLAVIRNQAVETASKLDFALVELSGGDWSLRARLNKMHDKFKQVSRNALSTYLDVDDSEYEYRALYVRNIIADHAPDLLTENVKVLVDPSQPLWRTCSAQASILLRRKTGANIKSMHVEQVATALPLGSRTEYDLKDNETVKSVSDMDDGALALFCRPASVADAKERGYALFGELNLVARETLLTRRLFETIGKSGNDYFKNLASERNRLLEHEPILQQGDLVHATASSEVLEDILSGGLLCGEAVMGNDRAMIRYPFTVSLLEVDEKITEHDAATERFDTLNNSGYGAISVVLQRDEASAGFVEYASGDERGVRHQRQVFGGIPSTDIKQIIIRDQPSDVVMGSPASEQTVAEVIQAVIKHGMFIPIVSGSTGEPLLTSQQFDQLRVQAAQAPQVNPSK